MYGIPKHQLFAEVEQFAKEKGFEDKVDLFKRAAILAQNPKEFEKLEELDEADREVIRRETTRELPLPVP